MAHYQFEALDAQGLTQSGSVQADNTQAAAQVLRARALYVVRIEQADGAQSPASLDIGAWLARQGRVKGTHLVLFYKQLGMMLRNGLTLLQAFDVSSTTVGSPRLSRVIGQMREAIESGASLSDAMAAHPRQFDTLAVELVRGAEASGELDAVMERIATDLERKADLKRQLITSLIYPGIVVFTAIGVSLFLVVGVVPKFAEFFAKSGRQLPPVTQSLLDISSFVQSWGPLFGLLGLVLAVATVMVWQRPQTRPLVDGLLLRVPVVGHAITVANMARFAWTAAMLTRSGVTIIDTLRVSSGVLGNAAIAQDVTDAAESVLSGRDLATSLRRPTVPPLVSQLAAVGERTGALDAVLGDIGDFYQKLLETNIKRLTAMIEPVLILLVASMVGYVYYAFFAALFAAAG